ncbi:hypothetical protein [Paractinoplanes brasiliensis]|uniref:Uncharacterized protein n=1 Tax=Paractinoplanes brasiliensis TaxID=52695 RepID=A0A4R6JR15_9ACTN|nr:hypothetical protein [Actinoplanes brasiliensis]TDO38152.1 hypothetical protein C8E87_1794 [Actinoplanes brasiliensis]GID33272.1 hypothetical protein Abr02nite_82550 [Actinoplanes brasiliensis]
MADPQPEETRPANGVPDPTRVDRGEEPSTVDAPARWSGSAAVPPPEPKRPWWRRNQPPPADDQHEHWATTPAVDPWADQDTPWDPIALPLEDVGAANPAAAPPLPPTRIEAPAPTRVETPAATPAPTRAEPPPAAPARAEPPASPPPPPVSKPISRPPQPPPGPPYQPPTRKPPKLTRKQRKEQKRLKNNPQPTANRLPIQTRPPAPPAGPMVRGRPLPAPPPWAPRPAARPMPPPRRKRRWGRRLALLSLLGVVCCCGIPFAWTQSPAAGQYPVTAALPDSFADLQLRDTEETGPSGFAGVYRDGRGKRVTVFGETGFRLTPGSDVRARIEQASAEYGLKDVQSFDLGEIGAHERCGVGRDNGASVVVCAWADHGSLATVLLTRRSVADSADLVARLRDEVLSPG